MASRMLPTESATTGQTTGSWRRHRYPAGIGGSGLLALGAAAGTADGSWPCAAPGKFVSPFRSRYKRRHALDMWQEAGTCPPPCRHPWCRWDVSTRGHLPIPQRSGRRASQGVFLATHTALRVALEPLSEWQPITELPPPCTRSAPASRMEAGPRSKASSRPSSPIHLPQTAFLTVLASPNPLFAPLVVFPPRPRNRRPVQALLAVAMPRCIAALLVPALLLAALSDAR